MTAKKTNKKAAKKVGSYSTNSRPVWCGEFSPKERELVNHLSADQRREALLKAAAKMPAVKKPAKPAKASKPEKKASKPAVKKTAERPMSKPEQLPATDKAEQSKLPF